MYSSIDRHLVEKYEVGFVFTCLHACAYVGVQTNRQTHTRSYIHALG